MASFARPKISSQFLRVNGILKFTKCQISLLKIRTLNLKTLLSKRETRGLELRSRPLIPLFKSPRLLAVTRRSRSKNPSHVRSACDKHYRAACVLSSCKFQANFKIYERVRFYNLLLKIKLCENLNFTASLFLINFRSLF